MIRWRRFLLVGCFAIVTASGTAHGQGLIQYNMFPVLPSPSPYPADWQTSHSLATFYFNEPEPCTADVQAVLSSPEGTWSTTPRHESLPATVTLLTPELAPWATLALTGKVKDSVDKTGHLPDGTYTLLVYFRNIQGVTGQTYQDQIGFMRFPVSVPQPPSLLYPSNQSAVAMPNPVFQWTPVFRPSGIQPVYLLRLVELLPMETPLQAIEANYPLLETRVRYATALTYPVAAPPLRDGRTYAWRVQAIEAPIKGVPTTKITPVGANEGRSQVFTFTWRPKVRAPGAEAVGVGATPGNDTPHEAPSNRERGEAPPPPRIEPSNFADRLVLALTARWHPRRAAYATAGRASRADLRRALSGTLLASYDSTTVFYGPVAPSADTLTTPAPAIEEPAPTPPEALPPPGVPAEAGFGPQWLKFHGGTSASGETYSRDGIGSPTRPFHSGRMTSGLSFGLMNDRVHVPLNALLSGDQVSFRQNINQVGLSPRFSWAGLDAGNFAPQYSTYSLADATVLGAGLNLTPRNWRIGLADGRIRKAIAADPLNLAQPQFERNLIAGRLGYGDPQANTVELSVMRAKDDESSLAETDTLRNATPEQNLVYALKTQGVLPRRHLRAQVEAALSRYDHDQRADAPTATGQALGIKLFRETVLSSVGASFEVLSGGFVSLGNSALANDRIDVGLTGRTQLLTGKLLLNGNLGWRTDNVSGTLLAETARRDYSLNASWQPRPSFGTDFQFGFMSSDVSAQDSVAGTGNISRVLAISPRVSWATAGIQQQLTTSATLQNVDNTTTASFPLTGTDALTLIANWAAVITPTLSLNLGGNYSRTDLDVAVTEISAFGPGFTWQIPRAQIATTAQLQFTRSRTGNFGTDTDFAPRCDVRWQTTPHHAFILHANFRRYRYAAGETEFNERTASVEYSATL